MPAPFLKTQIIKQSQTAWNIARQIKRAVNESKTDAFFIAEKFKQPTTEQTARLVYDFSRQKMPYRRESFHKQTARTLRRIIYDINNGGGFDCKHYATFAALIAEALNIPYKLRLISQNYFDKMPTHIYCVYFDKQGNEIIVDPCVNEFNREALYRYKYNLK